MFRKEKKLYKKIAAIFFAAILLVPGMFPFLSAVNMRVCAAEKTSWMDYAAEEFSGGNGTKASPYLISTAAELALLAKLMNTGLCDFDEAYRFSSEYGYGRASYRLTADIDLSGHSWTPIALVDMQVHRFKGFFDGGGHKISNMRIDDSFDDVKWDLYIGLFGLNAGVIRNVVLVDPVISFHSSTTFSQITNGYGEYFVGGIAGICIFTGELSNCSVENIKIDADNKVHLFCGGLVGSVNYAAMTNSFVTGSISATAAQVVECGGVCGDIGNQATVSGCGFSGSIYTENLEESPQANEGYYYMHAVGGFAGVIGSANSNINISNCYTKAVITSKSEYSYISVGGFVGHMEVVYEDFRLLNLYCESSYSGTDIESKRYGRGYTGTEFCALYKYDEPGVSAVDLARFADYTDSIFFSDLVSSDPEKLTVFQRNSRGTPSVQIEYAKMESSYQTVFSGFDRAIWKIDERSQTVSMNACGVSVPDPVNGEYHCVVTFSPEYAVFNGKRQKPAVTVKTENGVLLKEGRDYCIIYYSGGMRQCIDPGEYDIVILFLGNYIGKQQKTYEVRKGQGTGAYEAVDPSSDAISRDFVLLGDADLDWKVTAADARMVLRCSVKLERIEPGYYVFFACDVDGDGILSAADARKILRVSVRLDAFSH